MEHLVTMSGHNKNPFLGDYFWMLLPEEKDFQILIAEVKDFEMLLAGVKNFKKLLAEIKQQINI